MKCIKENMLSENGFSLVELLAVITILGVLSLIAVPIINNTISDTKQRAYAISVERVEEAAEQYLYSEGIRVSDDSPHEVTIEELISGGYLKELPNNMLKTDYVTIIKIGKDYEYTFSRQELDENIE